MWDEPCSRGSWIVAFYGDVLDLPFIGTTGPKYLMIRLFGVSIPIVILTLLFSEIIILIRGCFFLAGYWNFKNDLVRLLLYDVGLNRKSLVVTSVILGMHFSDLYTHIRVK